MGSDRPGSWLLLIHRVPSKPEYARVRVGRRVRELGAVLLKNSVYVLPATPGNQARAVEIAREILNLRGEAVVCVTRFVEGLSDGAIEDLFRQARDAEYGEVARRAASLEGELNGRGRPAEARRRRIGQQLGRLRGRFERIAERDVFGAAGRATAAGRLSLLEDRLQGVEEGAKPASGAPQSPRGATWVTRTGVMVDRIASAWLIRRFIDPAARFRFVGGRGDRPRPGEVRFDMAGAEHTHRDGLCTFEVLVRDYRLRDSALRPIAEIVHDLDLEDGRHGRQETAGVGRMIVGLAIASPGDEARLAQGGAVFETLYEAFRRRRA